MSIFFFALICLFLLIGLMRGSNSGRRRGQSRFAHGDDQSTISDPDDLFFTHAIAGHDSGGTDHGSDASDSDSGADSGGGDGDSGGGGDSSGDSW